MAAKYPNNLIVQVNKPLDEKLVCEKLSDLTEYLYVGLLTYQKLDGKYYYVKSIDGGVPTWEELKTGTTSEGGGEISEEVLREYAKKDEIPIKTSQLTNDSGYVSVIPNLLKNTNFGDGFNGWTKSGSVTIKNDVYEGIGAAYIDGGGMIGQDVTLDAGVYTLSFRVANGSISREWPLKVLLRRANVSNVVTNAEGWNKDDVPTIAVTSVSDKVYITFTLALASNISIDFENSRYGCLVDSIRLEKGDTVSPYDEYLMQKRLVSGLNISTINGQSLLGGGDIVISGGGGAASAGLSGQLSLVDLDSVKVAQSGLSDNEVRFYVIADSEGRLPSKQKCYDADSEVIRQLSLKTGNMIIDALLDNMEVEPIGVCVGDLIAITKVPVSIADLANNFGITIPLSGTISIFQYKILHTNSARVPSDEESIYGVDGLLKGYDKMVFERSSKPTKYGYGTPLDECLESGVLAYTSAEIGGITANWSVFVDCAATPDGSGYYHLLQKAVCRDEPYTGQIYERFGYYHGSGAMRPSFTEWKENGGAGGSADLEADFPLFIEGNTIGLALQVSDDAEVGDLVVLGEEGFENMSIGSGLEKSEVGNKLTLSLGSGLEFNNSGNVYIKLSSALGYEGNSLDLKIGSGLIRQDDGSIGVSSSYIAEHSGGGSSGSSGSSGSLKLGTGLFVNIDGEVELTTAVGLCVSPNDGCLKLKISTSVDTRYGVAGLFCGTQVTNPSYEGVLGIGLALSTEDCPFTFKEGMRIVDDRGVVIGTQPSGCAGLAFNYSDDFFINNSGKLCLATNLKSKILGI